jgi:hypothetical protein
MGPGYRLTPILPNSSLAYIYDEKISVPRLRPWLVLE